MIQAREMESVTRDPGYLPSPMMEELDNASAFEFALPVVDHHKPTFRPQFTDPLDQPVALTDNIVQIYDPDLALAHELGERANQRRSDLLAYKIRIEALCAHAVQEGYSLNAASKHDFWRFICSEPFIRKGNLILMDNGNLRAMWRDQHRNHIGLQFIGGRMVQYVIFKRREAVAKISRVAGRDSFDGVKRQIQAFDLQSLVYA
ncbi:hypothetical protein [Ruegeria sp. HKCCD8929]|uniref:hypothetical protein n=1 Tax=Ruegeria sp. HKCCD8929 TaxID=2683006 RepID=UPI001489D26A|nr:hypothetical protein [Ruegeria sp. HKCCD8929]